MSAHAPYYADDTVTLHHGDASVVASRLASAQARTIVTSPPYYGLRDYGHEDQIGSEATLEEYVTNLVTLFRELRRVLTDDGTLWLNLGDSYGPGKQLLGVPWEVAFALRRDGWILRSEVIWAKPTVMPEAVRDRPTRSHEQVFLFAKRPDYFYNAEAVAEPLAESTIRIHSSPRVRARGEGWKSESIGNGHGGLQNGSGGRDLTAGTRNLRDVWTVGPSRFSGAHFAVFPADLIRPCIRAGSAPGDTVLDPFSGSGTTGMVATHEGRRYIGIDVNAEYLDLSLRTRFVSPTLNLWDGVTA